ncbi:RagB/SusD family nutrient uptake outer membrane protein [Paraflavitalea sp. CAU 1676]|uniref:RagB/SusD family nutrient uptake outer membrane protein n=1 Tax=Paraflavitalea sp. CAU 1676 TaxID=3032598 RepID=UPI0023DA9D5C|nr:RagB/SusD family nutrient uptake outer membrane protein [Paraflavitalea sp. CAU 1676]MDF2190325.1 RagB/SusD family nutrient uptake outer membrane protein [Paraflavitalea sp. CAU 1676]
MTNNIFKLTFITIAASAVIIVGCKKSFLETSNPNQLTEDKFWKTEADVKSAVASVYSPMRLPLSGYWGAFRGYQDINALGDDVLTIPGGEPSTTQVAYFINDAKNGDIQDIFSKLYSAIYRANLVIENAGKANLDATLTKSYQAEAKFLRGLSYFLLASNFGDVPLKTTVAQSSEDAFIPASPMATVYQQAIKDFTESAGDLPVTRPAGDKGRITQGAVYAFLGKAYLYIKDYGKAESTLAKLLTAPYDYDLVSNFEDNFTDKKEFNKESVLEWVYGPYNSQYSPWNEESGGNAMYNYRPQLTGSPASGGWFKYIPSQFLVKEFKKELRPGGSDTKFDKRMYATLMWKYSDFGETDATWYDNKSFDALWAAAATSIDRFEPIYKNFSEGKFLNKKFTSAWRDANGGDNYWSAVPSTANVEVMRFAEVLLLHAEAALLNNHPDIALQSINRIRQRAGLTTKVAADFPAAADLMNELRHQKLLEFYFEQNRWNDLKRWFPAAADLKAYMASHLKQGADKVESKHYIFPIPAAELQTNNKLTQNPLWK